MGLKKITGNTYYMTSNQNNTLINCGLTNNILIDSGINRKVALEILKSIKENNEEIKYILNTHGHLDHCGGNATIIENSNATLLATKEQQPFLEQENLLKIFSYGAVPIDPFPEKNRSKGAEVSRVIGNGNLVLGKTKLHLIPTLGHSLDHVIIVAEDDSVAFCGDILMSEELINDYKVPLMLDVDEMLKNLKLLDSLNYNYYLHSHVAFGEDQKVLIEKNISLIKEIGEFIFEFCTTPKGREEIVGEIISKRGILRSPGRFTVVNMTVGAYLTYLLRRRKIKFLFEKGILKYMKV